MMPCLRGLLSAVAEKGYGEARSPLRFSAHWIPAFYAFARQCNAPAPSSDALLFAERERERERERDGKPGTERHFLLCVESSHDCADICTPAERQVFGLCMDRQNCAGSMYRVQCCFGGIDVDTKAFNNFSGLVST